MERKIMEEFIEIYRSEPALWKVKSLYYNNKTVKNIAYKRLSDKLKEIYHDADVEFVKKKINALRTNFRKEVRKVEASRERNKMTGEPIYEPSLWYYDLFQFIADQENELKACEEGTIEAQELMNVNMSESEYYNVGSDPEFEEEFQMSSPESQKLHDTDSNSQNISAMRYRPTSSGPKRKRDIGFPAEEWYPTVELERQESSMLMNEHEIFGQYVATKLSTMDRSMQLLSERLMSEILYRGQTGCLDRFTSITDGLRNIPKNEVPHGYQH